MKHVFLLLLLFSYNLPCFSQTTKADSLKDLNDLKSLRSQLVEKSSKLEAEINDKQILIDSCLKKLQDVKAEAAKLKLNATKKEKKSIEKREKEIEQLNITVNDKLKHQSDSKELLEKVTQLIKELDSKINALSKASE